VVALQVVCVCFVKLDGLLRWCVDSLLGAAAAVAAALAEVAKKKQSEEEAKEAKRKSLWAKKGVCVCVVCVYVLSPPVVLCCTWGHMR
jgi:hypothetical protein